VVLAEGLDRVSRDHADVATLFKHLRFAGVSSVPLSEGEITDFHVGLKWYDERAVPQGPRSQDRSWHTSGRVEKGKYGSSSRCGYNVV
jgi:hypothetical protein